MATSWFKYHEGGTGGPPETNPLNFTAVVSVSPIAGSRLNGIFAEVQMIVGVPRPVITSALATEIVNAVSMATPTANVYLKP